MHGHTILNHLRNADAAPSLEKAVAMAMPAAPTEAQAHLERAGICMAQLRKFLASAPESSVSDLECLAQYAEGLASMATTIAQSLRDAAAAAKEVA